MTGNDLTQLLEELDRSPDLVVPRSTVFTALKSSDLEAAGGAYMLIANPSFSKRIQPPLTKDDYVQFVMEYFERCFPEHPVGDYSHSSYIAGADFVRWFMHFWNESDAKRAVPTVFKDWLRRLYLSGDEHLKDVLVNGILEHLFENRKVLRFFRDWDADPELKEAVLRAAQWAKKHPNLDRTLYQTE